MANKFLRLLGRVKRKQRFFMTGYWGVCGKYFHYESSLSPYRAFFNENTPAMSPTIESSVGFTITSGGRVNQKGARNPWRKRL